LRKSSNSLRAKVGFSLIEVVIAVAIFGAAATVLTLSFTNALLARERSIRHDLLEADVRAVRMQLLLEPKLEDAEDGGRFKTLHFEEASWEATIEPTNIVDLFKVELRIDFSNPPEDLPGEHTEILYLLRPTWSESDERSDLLQEKREALEDMRGGWNF
jgi:prepilin-type N-terminal cleavage/methylation domain-containing protein